MGMVLTEGLKLATVGVVIGLGAAALLSRSLASQLYQVQNVDLLVYVGVTLFTVTVTALATSVPARRATRVDPIVTMKAE